MLPRSSHVVTLIAFLSLAFNVWAVVRYVDLNSASPESPFTDWTSAATNIQDAIDVADPGDQILVANGVYVSGGQLVSGVKTTNRVAVTKALTLQSVNGPAVTVIQGYQVPGTTNGSSAVRCVYLANGAALIGFTLTNGSTQQTLDSGGGVSFQTLIPTTSIVSNCVLTSNSAGYGGGGASGGGTLNNCAFTGNWARLYGGGANGCTLNYCTVTGNSAGGDGGGSMLCQLNNCILTGNSAGGRGGGAYAGTLTNCTLSGNSAGSGGGGIENASRLINCIVYYNNAPFGANYFDSPMLYSCTTPLASGFGSITNAPLFVDQAGGDFHLQSNSPCINAGRNASATRTNDLDGNPGIVGGTVDMGAYEFQSPASTLSYAWAQQYGLPTDGSADFADPDGDGMDNWHEWRSDTVPTNGLSLLKIETVTNNSPGLRVTWQSVNTRSYWLERATDLNLASSFQMLKANIAGFMGTTTYTDTTATNVLPYFYRLGVQ